MITGRLTRGETQVLLLGLSEENVRRLQARQPILCRPATHGGIPEGWELWIMYGDNEGALLAELKQVGMVGPDTELLTHPAPGADLEPAAPWASVPDDAA
jgi:hypothetical protein